MLLSFKGSVFEGDNQPVWAQPDFQMIQYNQEFAPYIDGCTRNLGMNAYVCKEVPNLGILLFESEDPDRMDRSMQPIYVKKEGTGMENKLNSFMDHVWDGFYSSQ